MLKEYSKTNNIDIYKSFIVTKSKLDNPNYKNIMISISGGSDSDILLDLCERTNTTKNLQYVFFNPGLEYTATKEHLIYLEKKYGIHINRINAKMPIPVACKKFGQPFLSKQVSENIYRLQSHNFKWEDRPYDELYKEYPNCKAALMWWCNKYTKRKNGGESSFNIAYNRYLKEFIVTHPPQYKISKKCCVKSKEETAIRYKKSNNIQLSILGLRKAEGGQRSTSIKNCFTSYNDKSDEYRPLFWYTKQLKALYEDTYKVKHSRCYSMYNLNRTGCAGCPYGKNFEQELEAIKSYEPHLYKAVTDIFRDSYSYTRAYIKFIKEKENERSEKILKINQGIHTYTQLKLDQLAQ